nr:DMT family transporter [uncultured Pseudomonas sp.]
MGLNVMMFAALGLFWGSNFIYMKLAASFISPAQITLLRVCCGFVPLVLVAWQRGALKRKQLRLLPHFLVMALLATAFYYFAIAKGTERLPSAFCRRWSAGRHHRLVYHPGQSGVSTLAAAQRSDALGRVAGLCWRGGADSALAGWSGPVG